MSEQYIQDAPLEDLRKFCYALVDDQQKKDRRIQILESQRGELELKVRALEADNKRLRLARNFWLRRNMG